MKNTKTKELAIRPAAETETAAINPMGLLSMAVDKNLDIEKLERLMTMNKDWQAQQAKKEFFASLSGFQADCPEIKKVRKVDYTSQRTQAKIKYAFASLSDIEKQIKAPMLKHGLSKQFRISQEGAQITVTCEISHSAGHTEKTAMTAALDDSGSKNQIQQAGSTITYLQRYALLAALGITTADTDDDGRGHGEGNDLPVMNEEALKKAVQHVLKGEITIAEITSKRSVTKDQLKALEAAEKSAKEKQPKAE